MAIQINTGAVITAAEQIDTTNKQIRSDLSELDSAIKALQQSWKGEAATSCINKYDYIKNSFADARFGVINNVVMFMKKQVGEAYDQVDKAVASAASAFK